jgi:hypothetical protein
MKNTHGQVQIVEIVPDCGWQKVRLAYFPSGSLAYAGRVIVCDDDSTIEGPTYLLHVSCRESHMDSVSNLYSLHNGPHGKSSSETLAEYVDPFCVDCERCALRNLTVQELLFPITAYELATDQSARPSHRYN